MLSRRSVKLLMECLWPRAPYWLGRRNRYRALRGTRCAPGVQWLRRPGLVRLDHCRRLPEAHAGRASPGSIRQTASGFVEKDHPSTFLRFQLTLSSPTGRKRTRPVKLVLSGIVSSVRAQARFRRFKLRPSPKQVNPLLRRQSSQLSLEFFRIDLMLKGLDAIYEDNRDVILVALKGQGLLVDIDFAELELVRASCRQNCRFGVLAEMTARSAVYDDDCPVHKKVKIKSEEYEMKSQVWLFSEAWRCRLAERRVSFLDSLKHSLTSRRTA